MKDDQTRGWNHQALYMFSNSLQIEIYKESDYSQIYYWESTHKDKSIIYNVLSSCLFTHFIKCRLKQISCFNRKQWKYMKMEKYNKWSQPMRILVRKTTSVLKTVYWVRKLCDILSDLYIQLIRYIRARKNNHSHTIRYN